MLFIRPRSQHAACTECVRHKVIIHKLRKNTGARRAQLQLYQAHLRRQYADRCVYWKARADSKLGELSSTTRRITAIIDSMDHSKFGVPKSVAIFSKQFGQFIRPTLSTTCCIIHGYCTLFYMSEPHVAHDSSWTAEVLAHALHVLQGEFPHLDLRRCHLSLHGDNSSKELKNNCCVQLMSSLVSTRRLRSAALQFLQSGHSHEDVDQLFSGLATWISGEAELHTPQEYVESLQRWLNQPQLRQDERFKRVYKVDQNRAWPLWYTVLMFFKCWPSGLILKRVKEVKMVNTDPPPFCEMQWK